MYISNMKLLIIPDIHDDKEALDAMLDMDYEFNVIWR